MNVIYYVVADYSEQQDSTRLQNNKTIATEENLSSIKNEILQSFYHVLFSLSCWARAHTHCDERVPDTICGCCPIIISGVK